MSLIIETEEPVTTPAPAENHGHLLTRQYVVVGILVLATLLIFFLCAAMLKPFLTPLAWALALAVIAHPLHAWLESRIANPNIAALISVSVVVVVLMVPIGFVLHQLVGEAANYVEVVQSPEAAIKWRETLETTAWGQHFLWLDAQWQLTEQVGTLREQVIGGVTDVVRGSLWTIANALITIFSLFYMFRDRRWALQALMTLSPLSPAECAEVFTRVSDTIYATVYGSVTMAMIQGTMGGLMFWWLGLPTPILWGLIMALLATIPNLGTFIIWAPTAAGLALQGRTQDAIVLAVWGLIAIGLIDNLLYPMMVGKRMQMHSAVVFFAVVGGLLLFGAAGLILGPVVFAVAEALIEIWRRRTLHGQSAERPAPALVVPASVPQKVEQLVT
jgi:predicted PurR-regulated permease PerM